MVVHLQKTTGEKALGITQQEADHIVRELLKKLTEAKRAAGFKRTDKFYICFDHATVHNNIAEVLGRRAKVWPQPTHSPDCNKPIEHVHAQVDAGMKKWLRNRRQEKPARKITVEQSKVECTRLFESIPTKSIADDVASLPQTWQAIVAADGGFVPDDLS